MSDEQNSKKKEVSEKQKQTDDLIKSVIAKTKAAAKGGSEGKPAETPKPPAP